MEIRRNNKNGDMFIQNKKLGTKLLISYSTYHRWPKIGKAWFVYSTSPSGQWKRVKQFEGLEDALKFAAQIDDGDLEVNFMHPRNFQVA